MSKTLSKVLPNQGEVVALLNRLLENEMAGVVRYTHYSFMVFGPHRIPIITWLQQQASESLTHSQEIGEIITHLGEHPSLGIGPLLETHQHDLNAILSESLEHESAQLELYRHLLELVKDRSILIEEFARRLISAEELHVGEVDKMLRQG